MPGNIGLFGHLHPLATVDSRRPYVLRAIEGPWQAAWVEGTSGYGAAIELTQNVSIEIFETPSHEA